MDEKLPKETGLEEKTGTPRRRAGRPAIPGRKCYSFYCTSDEKLYLESLLRKIRNVTKGK